MTRPRLTVGAVMRSCRDEVLGQYGEHLLPEQRRALLDLTACRTAALGGHILGCPECGHQQIAYNSCGNRHCPTCQATDAARWLEARAAELLPVPYFHLVFTLPDALDPIALANPRVAYGLLLRCAAETVLALAADPEHLGARTGVLAVLHTWGQALQFHPHVHCVVPGGGLSPDRRRFIASGPHFFLPVRVLSRVFRGKFLAALRAAYARGELRLGGRDARQGRLHFERLLSAAVRSDWVVYAKPPFGGPEVVLKYLARYTHRAAISNSRLLDLEDGFVRFRYTDYAHGTKKRVMKLSASEFVRRFLLHVLPRGFVRIRHYGLLSNEDGCIRRAAARVGFTSGQAGLSDTIPLN
jgi:Putative transposase/Transposase zinc-binding domain